MGSRPEDGLRVPPHSGEAEQCVLGALMTNNRLWPDCAEILTADSFYQYEHRAIWGAIDRLMARKSPADVVTVFEALGPDADAVGGLQYLDGLARGSHGVASNATAYARIVRRNELCRRMIVIGDALMGEAYAGVSKDADVDAVIERVVLALLGLQAAGGSDDPRPMTDLLPTWIEEIEARAEGVSDALAFGLRDLDRQLLGGPRRGDLVVLGARPSMGKSAFTLGVMRAVSAVGPVLACSMEDSAHMLVSRHVASVGRVNLAHLRRPDRAPESLWGAIADAVEQLRGLPIWVDDRSALGLRDVRRKAAYVKRKAGDLPLVVVDYLQLMAGRGETRAYELADIVRGLKALAKDLQCVVLLLSQLNREADKVIGPPRIEHLAESGAVEQAADIIMLLWRAGKAKPQPGNEHEAQVEVAKHKNGPTGTVRLWWDGAMQRFDDWANDVSASE